MRTLHESMLSFLGGLRPNNLLLLTTFGLDEVVALELLREAKVSRQQHILILHDVTRHLFPGLIQSEFENARTCAISLRRNPQRPDACPVFHAKLWAELVKKGGRHQIQRIAVGSLNLRRFHLSQESRVLDSFVSWNLTKPIPVTGNWKSFQKLVQHMNGRVTSVAQSWWVRTHKNEPVALEITDNPMIDHFLEIRGLKSGPQTTAAPFVNRDAIQALCAGTGADPLVFHERSESQRTELHLKSVETQEHLLLGSPNLTLQALGLKRQGAKISSLSRPVNTEIALMLKRPIGPSLQKTLKAFPSERLSEMLPSPEITPGDVDDDSEGCDDWLEAKRRADAAPEWIELVPLEREVGLQARHNFCGARTVVLQDSRGNSLELTVSRGSTLKIWRQDQASQLARLIHSPPVRVTGLRGREKWVTELSLGVFWEEVIKSVSAGYAAKGIARMSRRGILLASAQATQFADVREKRLPALETVHRPIATFARQWLERYGGSMGIAPTPKWCFDLARKLRALDA